MLQHLNNQNGLQITYVDGVPVVTDQDDEADTPHVIDKTPEEVKGNENDDGNVYARELPVPSMEGYPFQQPALNTVFCEMFKNLQMRCSDMIALKNPAFVKRKSLIIRTIHAGLLEQMDQLEEIIGPINEEHTLIAYMQQLILLQHLNNQNGLQITSIHMTGLMH